MPTKSEYLQFIEAAYQADQDHLEEERQKALQAVLASTPLFGYFPPRWMAEFAFTCGFLYTLKGEARLAEQTKHALFFYRDWLKHLPKDAAQQRPEYADGIPPMEPVFQPIVFVPAVQSIRGALSAGELESLVEILADSLRPLYRFPEWGGHNRAMLRAAGLAAAGQAFPSHPEAANWTALADELAEESWGRWSIEDAMLYQSHWLRAMIRYAQARGKQAELKDMIQPRLHLKAITQLISPLGILPDYGDSHWLMHSHWEWTACLEWGAAAYQDETMKWTARRIFESFRHNPPGAYPASVAILGLQWCDESVPESPPLNEADALDDLVSKKIVWRTGWERGDSYAMLNYRDEGDYGRVARDYLRTTLAVSAEKMHHGHADEGGFSMLVHQGGLLLHESGYRESPPDGIYRSAVYHNRVVWQPGMRPKGVNLLEFLRGDGHYQAVRTERLYATHLGDARFDRVRVMDERQGLVWDRAVIFLPALPCWIVVDGVTAVADRLYAASQAFTLGALWWTTDLLAQGEGWFETRIRGIGDWPNPGSSVLLVGMPPVPQHPGGLSAEPFQRHYQPEVALARTWYGGLRLGRTVNFVSLLWPHAGDDMDPGRAQALRVVTSQPASKGLGVCLDWGGERRLFGVLNDLAAPVEVEDIRPRYTAALGMTAYDELRSDAALAYWRQGAAGEWAGFINGTHLSIGERVLYQGLPHGMFQEDATDRPGIQARFRWES